jgi:hypothetical protein
VGTAGKVAIGCGIAVLIAGIVGIVAVGGLAWWAKGKAEEFTNEQSRIEELHRKANANRFSVPADGVVSEDRLRKFLEVRRRVYAVYERHKDELDAMSKKKQGDFGDVRKGFALINELRLAQAQALADARMSEDEYRFLVEQIYKSAGGGSVPPANVALFRRYEADITRYAMGGLEWVGL